MIKWIDTVINGFILNQSFSGVLTTKQVNALTKYMTFSQVNHKSVSGGSLAQYNYKATINGDNITFTIVSSKHHNFYITSENRQKSLADSKRDKEHQEIKTLVNRSPERAIKKFNELKQKLNGLIEYYNENIEDGIEPSQGLKEDIEHLKHTITYMESLIIKA